MAQAQEDAAGAAEDAGNSSSDEDGYETDTAGDADPSPSKKAKKSNGKSSSTDRKMRTISAFQRASQLKYKKDYRCDGSKLFCRECDIVIDHVYTGRLKDHLTTQKHLQRKELNKKRREQNAKLKQTITVESGFNTVTTAQQERVTAMHSLVLAFSACKIPLEVVDVREMRHWLQEEVRNGGNVPSARTLRSGPDSYLQDVFKVQKSLLKRRLKGKDVAIILDETSDKLRSEARFVLQILLVDLSDEDESGNAPVYLADTAFFSQPLDHGDVAAAVIDCLNMYEVKYESVRCYSTDNAAYCLKSFSHCLRPILRNSVHITCNAHVMNLVAEAFRQPFSSATNFMQKFQALFKIPGSRLGRFMVWLENTYGNRSSHIVFYVKTRWSSWLDAAKFHDKFAPFYAQFFSAEMENEDPPQALIELNEICSNTAALNEILLQLRFIVEKSARIHCLLRRFESREPIACSIYDSLRNCLLELEVSSTISTAEISATYADTPGIFENCSDDDLRSIQQSAQSGFQKARDKLSKYVSGTGQPGKLFLQAMRLFNPREALTQPTKVTDYSAIPGFCKTVSDTELKTYFKLVEREKKEEYFDKIRPRDFLLQKVQTVCPQLAKIGLAYANVPTNSVDAERMHSVYGLIMSPQRRSSSIETLKAESFLAFNGSITAAAEHSLDVEIVP